LKTYKKTLIKVTLVILSFLLMAGQALAAPYTRYVLQSPEGNTVYLFTTGGPGLELLLRQIYGPRYPLPVPIPIPEPEPEPEPLPEPEPEPKDGLTADERTMIQLVNKEREKMGLDPLLVNMSLVELARMKSQDMIDHDYFGHQSPTYGSPFDMMKSAGIQYRTAGENLAGAHTVEIAHHNLMNSPGHRQNILNSAFTHVGVGVVKGGPYGIMFTQMFIGK
jgi:uncharacterized YkwD family protein